MNKAIAFFAVFKHLGALQICIYRNSAVVVSILGVSNYNFPLLPENRDNRIAILQLAFKAYLNEKIDNFDNLETIQPPKTSIFDFFSRFSMPLALEAGSFQDKIKGAMMKDFKEYKWWDTSVFKQIENCEEITSTCIPPVVSRFLNFKEKTFFNSKIENEIGKIKPCKKSVTQEELNDFLIRFIISEFKFHEEKEKHIKILENEMNLSKDVLKRVSECHDSIYQKLLNLIQQTIIKYITDTTFISEISNKNPQVENSIEIVLENTSVDINSNQSSDLFLPKQYNHCSSSSLDSKACIKILMENLSTVDLNSGKISEIYIESLEKLSVYFELEKEFVNLADSQTQTLIKEAHASLITHVTKYLDFFKQLIEKVNEHNSKLIFLSFQQFNKNLNDTSEKAYLKKLAVGLEEFHKNDVLNATLECMLSKTIIRLYLFENILLIIDSKKKILAKLTISNMDIFLYNKMIFIISSQKEDIWIKWKPIENTNLNMIVLDAVNREVSREFCDTFYTTKYKCLKFKEVFFLYENSDSISLTNPNREICFDFNDISDKLSNKNELTLDQKDYLREDFIINLKTQINLKKLFILNLESTHCILAAILKETNISRLISFNFDTYVEEEVLFSRKIEILKELSDLVIVCRHTNIKFVFNPTDTNYIPISEFLIKNDILEGCDSKKQEYFIKKYLSLLLTNFEVKSIVNSESLEELVYLLGMLLQRNIYYFFDPCDFEKISKEDLFASNASGLDKIKAPYRKAFISIRMAMLFLQKTSESEYIEIILKSILK